MECKNIQCSSSSGTAWKHDVFVSFRGEDIRHNFADHLFGAFRREGIVAFRDDRNLRQGEHISTELMQAIEGSQVLMVAFSKNYANSSWCLDELAKIMDCVNMEVPTGQTVLPVFYDVSPSEVRKQSGDYYGKAFAEHEERFKHDLGKAQRWREALIQVANLSGWDVQNKPQYGEIENIVKRVKNIIGCKLSSDFDGPVGMDSRIEQLEKLLVIDSNDDVRLVGICGMGGMGKSTLARAVYDRNLHRYGATCFIDDISKVYRDGGQIAIQKQLLYQTLNEEIQDIWNLSQANNLIKARLCHQKAFIVLDNVDDFEQLEELGISRQYLYAGSRIIICSRDQHILKNYGVDEVYDAQLLNNDEAHLLFCRKAFKHDHIMSCDDINKEYEVLMDLVLNYAQGLPLAIKVLGSFLYGRDIFEWRSTLNRLRDNPEKKILDVLQISFDGLGPTEKEIFLDIACFFGNYDSSSYVKGILNCHQFHVDIGIRVLIDKSLIIVDNYNDQLTMHDLLQELGRNIVRQIAPNEPRKWSRIWRHEDFQNLMFEKMAMDNVQAIQLSGRKKTILRAEALSRMNRLRLLILRKVHFSGSINCLSNELRYLDWEQYPFTYFPSRCELIHLIELHLPGSKMKQLWEGIKRMDQLEIMDLSCCEHLVKTPDFNGTPNLKRLFLRGCTKLVHIHPSIGHLKKLVSLVLEDCTSLTSLPNSIFDLSSLELVILEGCSKVFHSDGVIRCQSTFSIFKVIKWPFHLPDSSNDIVGSQMSSLASLYCLKVLDLSFCGLLNIPEGIASLNCLKVLHLKGNNFVTLPCFIGKLPSLRFLTLDHCSKLSEFPLGSVFPAGKKLGGVGLGMFNCPKLVEIESLSNSALSWMIQFLKGHKESSPDITIVIPGTQTQIPLWFNHQSVGDSITIGSFPSVHDSDWIGIAFYATFVAHYHPIDSNYEHEDGCCPAICCKFLAGNHSICRRFLTDVTDSNGVTIELAHLCLLYFARQELITPIQRAKANMDVDAFSFKVCSYWHPQKFKGLHLEVKNCGVRVVFKQDLEEHNG